MQHRLVFGHPRGARVDVQGLETRSVERGSARGSAGVKGGGVKKLFFWVTSWLVNCCCLGALGDCLVVRCAWLKGDKRVRVKSPCQHP